MVVGASGIDFMIAELRSARAGEDTCPYTSKRNLPLHERIAELRSVRVGEDTCPYTNDCRAALGQGR